MLAVRGGSDLFWCALAAECGLGQASDLVAIKKKARGRRMPRSDGVVSTAGSDFTQAHLTGRVGTCCVAACIPICTDKVISP